MTQSPIRDGILLSLIPLTLLAWNLASGCPARVGDGHEYLLTYVAVVEFGRLTVDQEVVDRYNQMAERDGLPDHPLDFPTMIRRGEVVKTVTPGLYSPIHFWGYGVIAAIFAPFIWLFHLPFPHAFTLLHTALLGILTWIAYRYRDRYAAFAVQLLVLLSPLLWFTNKAHTEFEIFFAGCAAIIFLLSGRLPLAALVLAFAAAQNPPLVGGVAAIVLLWIWKHRRRWPPLAEMAIVAVAGSFVLLAPVYNLFRFGNLNPIATIPGMVSLGNVTVQKVLSLFLDPDIGLYPNWPFGLLLVTCAAAATWNSFRRQPQLFVFCAAYAVAALIAHTAHFHMNSGGTRHICRYSLWHLALHLPLVLSLPAVLRPGFYRIGFMTAACILFGWNLFLFRPTLGEDTVDFSLVGARLYRAVPWIYNPEPGIFLQNALGAEVDMRPAPILDPSTITAEVPTAITGRTWAVSNTGCTKIFVFELMLRNGHADQDQLPARCHAPLNARALFELARTRSPGRDFYLNLSGSDLSRLIR
jgi:hypothetical protein